MKSTEKTHVSPEVEEEVEESFQPQIVVFNDDVNTFEHVTECLVRYCKHGEEQALQCAFIIHNNGKCDVKRGEYDILRPIHEALLDNGLSSKIEI